MIPGARSIFVSWLDRNESLQRSERVLVWLGACLVIAAAINAPLAWSGVVVGWDDYAANILGRIAVGGEFAQYGFYHRYPLMLAGVDASMNGIDPKVDTIIFAALPAKAAVLTFYFLRAFALLACLSAILILHYRVRASLALVAATLATQGFNPFNWFFYGPDYAGAAFLFGYQLIPALVLPSLLVGAGVVTTKDRVAAFALSAVAGLIYSLATWFTLVIFALPLAVLWIALVAGRQAIWPIAGVVLGTSVVVGPSVLEFITGDDSVRRTLFSSAQIMSVTGALDLLVARDIALTDLGRKLLAAAAACAFLGTRRRSFAAFALLYVAAMLPDVVMKSWAPQTGLMTPLLLSVNFYTYVFAPIFFCGMLATGFNALPRILAWASSVFLVVVAFDLASKYVDARHAMPHMRLESVVSDPALVNMRADLLASNQRAAMVMPDVASLVASDYQLPRPIDAYLHAHGISTPGGFASNLDPAYSIFWTNVMKSPDAALVGAPGVFLAAYLELDVREAFAVDARGCLTKKAPITLKDVNVELLRLAATRYLVSALPLDDARLKLVHEGHPGSVYCKANPTTAGVNIYEIADAPPQRVSLAGSVHLVENRLAALDAMRRSSGAIDDVWIAEADLSPGLAPYLKPSSGKLSVKEDGPDRLVVEVDAEQPTLLVVRDRRMGTSRALVNSVPTAIVPANYVFMAIPVPAGHSTVEIDY